jgi:hypothetical protein
MRSVVTGAQARGSAIPEAIATETTTEEVEVTVPVAEVTEGTVLELEAAVPPRSWRGYMPMRSQKRAQRWSCNRPRFRMLCRSVRRLWLR